MQPRSALFDQTVANAHQVLVQADILSGGQVIARGLPVVGGSVTGNRKQFARRTCSVVIGDPALQPSGLPSDLLAPYGNEIRLWRGAVTPAGPELICVGTFGIRSVEFDTGAAFKGISVTGIDRSKIIAEHRFPYPYSTPDWVSAVGLVRQLVLESLTWAEVRIDPETSDAIVPTQTWTGDRDKAITDLLASVGAEGFFDPFGAFVIQPIPSPYGPPVYTVAGGTGGVLVSARRTLSRDGVFNGVVARGQSTTTNEAPVSSLMVDTDPTSPTYWYGAFGQVVGFYDSSLLTTTEQANNAAASMLRDQMGAARSLDYALAVNPALDLGDIVAVVDPDTGDTEYHLQDQLTIPLDVSGVMTAQTRSTLSSTTPIAQAMYSGSLS